jgi:MFS family permease
LLALFTRDVRHPRWLFVPYVIRGVGDLLLAVTRSVAAAWFLLFVYGLNTSSGMVIYQTAVQRHVPDAVRGRVFTWLDVVWNVMRIVSLGLGGWVADRVDVETVYYLGGVLLFVSGIVGLALFRDWPFEPPAQLASQSVSDAS